MTKLHARLSRRWIALAALLAAGAPACGHPTQRFEAVTQIIRVEAVEQDDDGTEDEGGEQGFAQQPGETLASRV
jgi:hypothetical protein